MSDSSDFPAVSVCIAARNEAHALADCLEQVLRSDYLKLEILVLDDNSSDDTSLIIKSFASAGVRFIAGKPLPEGWLGKNHAYQTLIDEASGTYVLFMDVDTTVKTHTISTLVNEIRAKNLDMISVLPRRDDGFRSSVVFGTFRYLWELVLSNRANPPASSAIWMINRSMLENRTPDPLAYKMSIRLEHHYAKQLSATRKYAYVIGDRSLGVSFEKRLKSQYDTAFRLYYPISGRCVRTCAAVIALMLAMLPNGILFAMQSDLTLVWASVLSIAITLMIGAYGLYTNRLPIAALRALLWPLLLTAELVLLLISIVKHKSGTLTWKGRSLNAQPAKHDAISLDE